MSSGFSVTFPAYPFVRYNKKKCRCTKGQISYLVDMMAQNKNLALGRYSGPMGHEINERMWAEVSEKISEYGTPKSAQQWKTTWKDLKKKVRTKCAKIAAVKQTGETPDGETPELSDIEKKILSIIDPDSSEDIEENGMKPQNSSPQSVSQDELLVEVDESENRTFDGVHIKEEHFQVEPDVTFSNEDNESVPSTPVSRKRPYDDSATVSASRPTTLRLNGFGEDPTTEHRGSPQEQNNQLLAEIVATLKHGMEEAKLYRNHKMELLEKRLRAQEERNEIKRLQPNEPSAEGWREVAAVLRSGVEDARRYRQRKLDLLEKRLRVEQERNEMRRTQLNMMLPSDGEDGCGKKTISRSENQR